MLLIIYSAWFLIGFSLSHSCFGHKICYHAWQNCVNSHDRIVRIVTFCFFLKRLFPSTVCHVSRNVFQNYVLCWLVYISPKLPCHRVLKSRNFRTCQNKGNNCENKGNYKRGLLSNTIEEMCPAVHITMLVYIAIYFFLIVIILYILTSCYSVFLIFSAILYFFFIDISLFFKPSFFSNQFFFSNQ